MSPSHSFARSWVTSIDIGTGAQSGPSDSAPIPMPHRAHVIVRLHGYPIGDVTLPLSKTTDLVKETRSYAWNHLREEITTHLRADGIESPDSVLGFASLPAKCSKALDAAPPAAPKITVALATVGNDEACMRTIDRVLESKYPNFEVVVVDNTPGETSFGATLQDRYSDERVRFAHETRKGLSFARNRGLEEAVGDVIVFTDDDVITDPGWLFAIAHTFVNDPKVACVTGSILAAEIETPAQAWLEQYGGYNKGFNTQVFDLKENRRSSALYPYDSGRFGSGANIAMKRNVLKQLGGFAVELGAGTPAHGGEDIDLLRRVVSEGHRLVYEPAALLWHFHRRSYFALRKQMYRYGVGLSATVMKWLLEPKTALAVARRLPAGALHIFSPKSTKNKNKDRYYPAQLTWLERLGIACGPFLYLKSRVVVKGR